MLKQNIPPENGAREGGGLCDGGLQLTGGEYDTTAAPTPPPACTMASVGLGKGQDSHSSLDALKYISDKRLSLARMAYAESPIQYQ